MLPRQDDGAVVDLTVVQPPAPPSLHGASPHVTLVDHSLHGPAQARSAVAACAARLGLDADADDLLLVVSELVTNAVLHGLPPVRVRLRSAADALSVEVFDQGHVLPDRGDGEPDQESGRGLLLVEVLANRWGSRASGAGKVVWAELPLPDPDADPGD